MAQSCAWYGRQMARSSSAAADTQITRSSCGRRRPENASTPSKATGSFSSFRNVAILSPHRGRGVDSGGERRRRTLLTQFTTPKQCPDQQRQILVRRHHARFLQRGFLSKRQQRQAVECGNGRAAQEARGPQVTAFCQALRVSPMLTPVTGGEA